jgi:hypothetical protein
MLHDLIMERAHEWAASPERLFRAILDHIRTAGRLRPPQVGAITVWAYFKIAGEEKPLGMLFAEGFFIRDGEETGEFWDGTVTVNRPPLRFKVRSVLRDETIVPLAK